MAILTHRCYIFASAADDTLQGDAGLQRCVEINALRRAKQFNPEDHLKVCYHLPQATRTMGGHADVVLSVVGVLSVTHGFARCLFSLIRAAVVTSAII